MNEIHDVIEAFADGEPVDPARLTQALSEAEGREHLIDLLVLRGLVGAGFLSDRGTRRARRDRRIRRGASAGRVADARAGDHRRQHGAADRSGLGTVADARHSPRKRRRLERARGRTLTCGPWVS